MSFGNLQITQYWNASTNSPKLASGKGRDGVGYLVSVAGSTNLDGISTWNVDDIVVFILDQWVRIAGPNSIGGGGGGGATPAGSDGDIQIRSGSSLAAISHAGGSATDYLAYDNSYKPIPAGGGGGGGAVTGPTALVMSRAAAITTNFVSVGSGGPAAIKTLGYANAGDGGEATFVRVGSAPTYSSLIWFRSADLQYWSMLRTNEPFKLEQAGGGTGASGATNNAAVEAINSMFLGAYKFGSGYGFAGASFLLGYGRYNFATPWFVKGSCSIKGLGNGMFGGYASELKFPANCDGIVLGTALTNGRLYNPGAYADYDARGTSIRDLKITGGWDQVETTMYSAKRDGTGSRGYGILTKAVCSLQNLYINRFAEMGVYTKGTIGGGGSSSEPAFGTGDNAGDPTASYVCNEGNVNNFTYITVFTEANGCDGFRDIGADANAGSYISCSATQNGAWGFNSLCFLGNNYFGCHSATNGGPWYYNSIFDPTSGKSAGAYQAWSDSNYTVMAGCYSEIGQAASVLNGFSMVYGGLHAAGSPQQGPMGFYQFHDTDGGNLGPMGVIRRSGSSGNAGKLLFNGAYQDGEMMQFMTDAGYNLFIRAQFARMRFGTYDKPDSLAMQLAEPAAAHFGRSVGVPHASWSFAEGVWLGAPGIDNDNDPRWVGVLSAVPTSGTWARGDRFYLRDPSAGGPPGYVCTSGGTPGTWKAMANLAS